MNFVAIDFETANPNRSSICQVGVVVFKDGVVSSDYDSLIDPEDYFHGMNSGIHGIKLSHVIGAPKFPEIYKTLSEMMTSKTVVCHSTFDKVAIHRAIEKYKLKQIDCFWLDTAAVVRRTWPQFATRGYGIKNVAKFLEITFNHHHAKEDARIAGEILVRAITKSGCCIDEWATKVKLAPVRDSINFNDKSNVQSGDWIVFTGTLLLSRKEASERALRAGYNVNNAVGKDTDYLVVGDQDIARLGGKEKSSKHLKAEALVEQGSEIKIIGESDFLELLRLA